MTTPIYIESNATMEALISKLSGSDYVAIDTEFQREHSYYPQLALVQIASDDVVACIDPLAFDAHEYLSQLILDQDIIKVFHSCSQDLEVLHRFLGHCPVNVHDTQIASAMLRNDQQISYAALVLDLLGIELDKSQTRTDWLRRPLSRKQLEYAADDVIHLNKIYPMLLDELREKGRLQWFEQDCASLNFDADSYQQMDAMLWRRVKGSNKLKRRQLAVVQTVANWREHIARERDRTRRRILPDDIVINIAMSPPDNLQQLERLLSRSANAFQHDQLRTLVADIELILSASPETWPDNRFQVLDANQKQLLKKLQTSLAGLAESLGIAPAMLYSRKFLEKLIRCEQPQRQLDADNWRYRCAGEELLQLIENSK